jgi:hypothetical protein
MRTATIPQVRKLLRDNLDGLTLDQINAVMHRTESNLRRVLKQMPDTYIDRWVERPRKAHAAVWCVVIPPEDCPRPRK